MRQTKRLHGFVAIRTIIVLFGAGAVCWGARMVPEVWRYGILNHVADGVIAGGLYKPKALSDLATIADAAIRDPLCEPAALRAGAIIHLRLLELDLEEVEQPGNIDERIESLRVSIRRALLCSPADSFLWLVLYWVDVNQNGFRLQDLEYLRMSYTYGPNEGWIALKRNGFAVAVFANLPAQMRDMVVVEFANLLNSGFERALVPILAGPGWKIRGRLLSKLGDVKEEHRQDFAKLLYRGGYDVAIPGIKLPDPRPWD